MEKRPYKKLKIHDLELLFERNSDDPKILRQLKIELKNRKTSRAKALSKRIQGNFDCLLKNLKNEDRFCEKCGNYMMLKRGKFGLFWGCAGYPECKNTKKATLS